MSYLKHFNLIESPLQFMFENYEVFGGSYRRNWQKKPPKLSFLYRCVAASLSIPQGCFCASQFYFKCTSVNRKDLINTPSGGGGNDQQVRTRPKPPIFIFLTLACEESNPMFSTMPSSNLKSFLEYNEPFSGYCSRKLKTKTAENSILIYCVF